MERLWTKSFILMTVGLLFLFTAFYMMYPTLPLFIKQMGGDEAQVGLSMGAFMLSAVIFRPIVGELLDRFGRRPFIVWGLLPSFFCLSLMAASPPLSRCSLTRSMSIPVRSF